MRYRHYFFVCLIGFTLLADRPQIRPSPPRFNQWVNTTTDFLDFASGEITSDLETDDDVARAAAYQPDHKLVVAGRAFDGTNNHVAVTRYHPDGSLDTSFDTDGKVVTFVGAGFGWAHGVAVDTTGRVVAGGRVFNGTSYDFIALRYTSSGALDATFHTDGIQSVDITGNADFARGVAIQDDGKIVLGGYGGTSGLYNFAVARLNANGTLDSSFHTDGIAIQDINMAANDLGHAVSLATTGDIYLAGSSNNGVNEDYAIARFNSDGTIDNTFETDGVATLDIAGEHDRVYTMVVQSDNKPIVGGRTNNGSDWDVGIVRFEADGDVDPTFNGGSATSLDIAAGADWVHGLALDGDERILGAGRTNQGDLNFLLVRYNTNGTLDGTLDTDGIVTTQFDTTRDEANVVVYDAEKWIAAGRAEVSGTDQFAVLRYNSTGSLAANGDWDEHFDTDGLFTTDVASLVDELVRVTVDGSGRTVAAGTSEIGGGGNMEAMVIRLTTSGSLDATFDTDGIANANVSTSVDEGHGLVIQTDGKIVISGYHQSGNNSTRNFMLARFNDDGSLDNTFDTDGIVSQDFDNDREIAYGVVQQSDGKLVTAGYGQTGAAATREITLMRFSTAGALDATFDTDGIAAFDVSGDRDQTIGTLIRQPDGKLVIPGYGRFGGSAATQDMILVRTDRDGAIDNSFDTDGRVRVEFAGNRSEARAVTLQTDGKLVAVGFMEVTNGASRQFGVARFNSDGSMDGGFGTSGQDTYDITTGNDQAYCVQQMANGKLLIGGRAGGDYATMKLNPDGSLDTSFDTDGVVIHDVGGLGNERWYDCTALADERIIYAGEADDDFSVGRWWP